MSQQAGIGAQQPAVVYPTPQWQPPFVAEPIPLKDQVTLYFRVFKADVAQVQQLVYLKTKRANSGYGGYENCGLSEQKQIVEAAIGHSKDANHPWRWNPENIGRYIASGLTQPSDLELATGLWEEDIQQMIGGREAFPPDAVAQMRDSGIRKAADERLKENRIAFPLKAEAEDRIRKDEQAMQAPPALTQEEIAKQAYLAGVAAKEIIEKNK